MNLLEGGEGRMGVSVGRGQREGGEIGMVGEGRGGRDDGYTYCNRYVH